MAQSGSQQRPRDKYDDAADNLVSVAEWTDTGNAARIAQANAGKLMRVSDMKKWHHWDGTRWAIDYDNREVREAAKIEAAKLPEGSRASDKFKTRSLSSAGINAAIAATESMPDIRAMANDLDAYPELLNTPSGIVNLRTGQVMPHDPKFKLSRITRYGVAPKMDIPKFSAFMLETFAGDMDMIKFIKRLCGLMLLGKVTEHILPFWFGSGANGKGCLALICQGILGDADAGGYAVSAPTGFLMAGRENAHPTEIARMRGARLVVCSEQTSGRKFDEAKVKLFTGGDKLTGRFMNGDFFEFEPNHLLLVLSNYLPEVKEGGESFWRRARVIEFEHEVPVERRDLELHEKILAAEGAGIHGWMVEGAKDVLVNGLQCPQKVMDTTKEYRDTEDALTAFVEQKVIPGVHCKTGKFRAQYNAYCKDQGVEPLNQTTLSLKLKREHKINNGRKKINGKVHRVYFGIDLESDEDE
jgi:P4 family phage/plasmid primase-like protien